MKASAVGGLDTVMNKQITNSYQQKVGQDFKAVLEKAREEKDDKKLREACQDMEATFIYQMLKEMRAAVPKGGLFEESSGTQLYREMLDQEYSSQMARSPDNLGLGDVLYKQLKSDMEQTQEDNGNIKKENK